MIKMLDDVYLGFSQMNCIFNVYYFSQFIDPDKKMSVAMLIRLLCYHCI